MEQSDPTFNLIVVSDLAPGDAGAPRVRAVDKDSIDALLREIGPTIEIPTGGARTPVTFQDFKDFRPERLAARVPSVSSLLEFRKQVQELAAGAGSIDAVRAPLQKLGAYPQIARALEAALATRPEAPAPAPAGPRPNAPLPTGSLFDLVDTGGAVEADAVSPEQVERTTAKLIDAVLGSSASGSKPVPAALRAVGAQAEAAVAPMLRGVLRDPRFQELEAAWRGLRLLVRSVDFRAGVRLHVIAASRANLMGALRAAALPLADDLRSQGKTCCLLLDFSFDGSEEELVAIAEDAAPRSLPVIASAGLEVAVREIAAGMGDASQGAWVRLRNSQAARWLALTANRFLLRAPYGAAGDPARGLEFEEITGPDTPLPWGRPGWVLAAFVAGSFARTGWGADFSGRDGSAAVESLPLRPGEGETTPLETDLNEAAVNALGDAGLLPLACKRGHDRPFAAGTSTVYKSKKDEPGTTLRYALFAASIGATMESLMGHIDLTYSIEEIARTIGAALTLSGMTERGSVFSASAAPVPGARPSVVVRISPRGGVLRGLPDITFEVPIALH
jgi:type VI secretion system protein ImpC